MNDPGRQLQLFAWHAEGRFLFIATTGGTYDLVKEQPISSQTLETIRREYKNLTKVALKLRRWDAAPTSSSPSQDVRFWCKW